MRKYSMKNYFFRKFFFQFLSNSFFKSNRSMSQLPTVFVKDVDLDEKLKIYFEFELPSELPRRTFTFLRPKDENVEVTLSRMKLKILEAINKKLQNRKKKKKSQCEVTNNDISLSLSLFKDREPVPVESKNINAWTENATLQINDSVYQIIQNPPSILHLSLPKSIMAGFPVYPKLELEYCSTDQCDFSWYRSFTKSDKSVSLDNSQVLRTKNELWLKLFEGFFYTPAKVDIGCQLRLACIPKSEKKIGLEEITTSLPVIEGPQQCPFEKRHQYTQNLVLPEEIRCVSYNILADLYADSDTARNHLFPYCSAQSLLLDYRKQLYLKELIGYNADLICLQEVDRKVFNSDLIPVLTSTGLQGIYNEKGGQVVEGLSCFYRTSKFKLVEFQAIILSEAVSNDPILHGIFSKLQENEKLKERFMTRTTALQVVLLECLNDPRKKILIGNTHLYFHPDSDNIRLLQASSCIFYLEHLLKKYKEQNSADTITVVLCGDFNSCPEFGVYHLMTKGFLDKDCVDWQSNPEETVTGMKLTHSLQMESACGTPEYTNYTAGFAGCLDYIFYDKSLLEVNDIVPFPKHEDVTRETALPSSVFPSDHIALISTLKWK